MTLTERIAAADTDALATWVAACDSAPVQTVGAYWDLDIPVHVPA